MNVLPHPFHPIRSFLSYASGEETITVKPEWAKVFPAPVDRSDERETIPQQVRAAASILILMVVLCPPLFELAHWLRG